MKLTLLSLFTAIAAVIAFGVAADSLSDSTISDAPGAALGILLLGSWLLGKVASTVNLSKITGFLLFGVIVSPNVTGWVTQGEVDALKLMNDLAISLIALSAGAEIELAYVRRFVRAIGTILSAQIVTIMLLVSGGMFFGLGLLDEFSGAGAGDRVMLGLIIATIATASSPAVVIALIAEMRARGPMTQAVLAVTVSKDLLLVVLFAIVMTITVPQLVAQGEGGGGAGGLFVKLLLELGGSVVIGGVVGAAMAWYVQRSGAHLPFVVIGASFGIALVSKELHLEPLIVALTAGLVMRNVWGEGTKSLFHTVEELSMPVYAVFFALAGCKVNPEALAAVWPVVAILVLARGGAIFVGTNLGAKWAGMDEKVRKIGWTAFVPQAGVSLALAYKVRDQLGGQEYSEALFNVLLSAVALHELMGPVLFKIGLTKSGEAGGADSEDADPTDMEGGGPDAPAGGGAGVDGDGGGEGRV